MKTRLARLRTLVAEAARANGLDVCRKLRSEAVKDTPVLMLTARDRLEDKLERSKAAYRSGVAAAREEYTAIEGETLEAEAGSED